MDPNAQNGKPQSLKDKLQAPLTVTLPTWAYLAAGAGALILLLAALD